MNLIERALLFWRKQNLQVDCTAAKGANALKAWVRWRDVFRRWDDTSERRYLVFLADAERSIRRNC